MADEQSPFIKKVYRGSRHVDLPESSGFGGYHFGTEKAAQDRLDYTSASAPQSLMGKERIDPFEITLNNPYGTEQNPISETELYQILNVPRIRKEFKEKGFDGIIYNNIAEDPGSLSYLVFDKENIRPLGEPRPTDLVPLAVPPEEDPSQKKPKQTGKMWRGIGSLMRKRLFPIVQAAQLGWGALSDEQKGQITEFLNTPMHELVGMEKSGIDYFRQMLGMGPEKPEEGILSLPMDDARADISTGTEITVDAYKGMPSQVGGPITNWKGEVIGNDPVKFLEEINNPNTLYAGFFSDDPAVASHFAEAITKSHNTVYPVKIDFKNPLVIDGKGKHAGAVQFRQLAWEEGMEEEFAKWQEAFAEGSPYDGVILKNALEPGSDQPTTSYIPKDSSQIRFRFGETEGGAPTLKPLEEVSQSTLKRRLRNKKDELSNVIGMPIKRNITLRHEKKINEILEGADDLTTAKINKLVDDVYLLKERINPDTRFGPSYRTHPDMESEGSPSPKNTIVEIMGELDLTEALGPVKSRSGVIQQGTEGIMQRLWEMSPDDVKMTNAILKQKFNKGILEFEFPEDPAPIMIRKITPGDYGIPSDVKQRIESILESSPQGPHIVKARGGFVDKPLYDRAV